MGLCVTCELAGDAWLLPNCIRVAGWSHNFGNAMKAACKYVDEWPLVLRGLRALTKFLRNKQWRTHLKQYMEKLGTDVATREASKLGKAFRPNFIKWRYETVHDVIHDLMELRIVCVDFLKDVKDIFPSFQDGELADELETACAWEEMWSFLRVFLTFVLGPLEKARRWGMICACCQEVCCVMNGWLASFCHLAAFASLNIALAQ